MPAPQADASDRRGDGYWFRRGLAGVISAPAAILMASFVGFGSLARDAGWSVGESAMMTGLIWALPSQVVFVGSVAAGASLGTIMVAVALSAVRLLPMTVALMPVMRHGRHRPLVYYPASHFIAITAWVLSMIKLPDVPRPSRLWFFIGLGLGLTTCNIAVTVASHQLAPTVPPAVAAGLLFLTPIYFLVALWAAARGRSDHLGLVAGLVLGPMFHQIDPQLDILWAGIIGGTLAYALHKLADWRR